MTPDDLIAERGKTHGDFKEVAKVAQTIKYAFRQSSGWSSLSMAKREVMDAWAGKMARIVCGNPNFPDHVDDIVGYATLYVSDIDNQ
jgi:hypothetical protein